VFIQEGNGTMTKRGNMQTIYREPDSSSAAIRRRWYEELPHQPTTASPLDISSMCRHVKTPQLSLLSCTRQGIVTTLHALLGKPCTEAPFLAHSAMLLPIVGSRAHMHLDVIFCISPHLERCTRPRDSSRRALRNKCLHLVVIF